MTLIAWFMASKIGRIIAGAGALFLAVLTFGASQRRKGRKEAEADAKEADHENAADIRDNVERNFDKQLREYDDAGYRDDK